MAWLQELISTVDRRIDWVQRQLDGLKSEPKGTDESAPLVVRRTTANHQPQNRFQCMAKSVLDQPDTMNLFLRLNRLLLDQYIIWPRARLNDVLTILDPSFHYGMARALNDRIIPMLLCDPRTLRPMMAIGMSKSGSAENKIAPVVEAVLSAIGLPVIQLNATAMPSDKELADLIRDELSDPNIRVDMHDLTIHTNVDSVKPSTKRRSRKPTPSRGIVPCTSSRQPRTRPRRRRAEFTIQIPTQRPAS